VPELGPIERVASARGVIQPVALRINPALPTSGAKLVMGGQPTQFGIDEDQLPSALNALGRCDHITLVGIHAYLGSRILEVRAIRENTKQILDLALRIEASRKRRLAFVDIGGGFGVNYFHGEIELDLVSLGRELDGMVHDFKRRCPTTRILCELGRYLVAKAGVFVTSVRYVKRSRGRLFAICDGGSNCHASAAGLGALFRRNFPIARLTGTGTGSAVYTVTGPLCTPTDVIGESVPLGNLECGDLIGVYDSGAYGASASPVHLLGFGHPAEVLFDDGAALLIRRRTTVEEVLASQVSIPIELPG
jgi:diaminopimelate decarboxylase